jgi:hypothetical protein
MMLVGKVAGYIAIVASMLIYQQKTRKGLLIWKAVADVLWIVHYFLLGGYTGAVVTCVALVREVVFFRSGRHNKNSKLVLAAFLCVSVVCSVLTWGGVFSLFAMLGALLSIVSFWLGVPKVSRIMAFPISICMLTYGVSQGSVAVLINEILALISSTVGILRYDRKKQTDTPR